MTFIYSLSEILLLIYILWLLFTLSLSEILLLIYILWLLFTLSLWDITADIYTMTFIYSLSLRYYCWYIYYDFYLPLNSKCHVLYVNVMTPLICSKKASSLCILYVDVICGHFRNVLFSYRKILIHPKTLTYSITLHKQNLYNSNFRQHNIIVFYLWYFQFVCVCKGCATLDTLY